MRPEHDAELARLGRRRWLGPLLASLAVAGAGCQRTIEPLRPEPTPRPTSTTRFTCEHPETPNAGVGPLRRLTREEYDHAVRDLLDAEGEPSAALGVDDDVGGFHNNRTAIGELQVEQHLVVAEGLAARADLTRILPCDPAAIGEAACAAQFIAAFGRRAYRRPLDAEETAAFEGLYATGYASGGFDHGIRLLVSAFLQSPSFLHHVELGGAPDERGISALPPYELASRLSFFLWASIPDDPLLDAAAAGELSTPDGVEAQARRMLQDERAARGMASFHRQWWGLDDLRFAGKDAELHPAFDDALVDAMIGEAEIFSDYVVRRGDARLETLLTAQFSFASGGLFDLHGVADPGDGAETHLGYRRIDTPGRSGLLTLPGVMAAHSHSARTSPTLRGKLIRQRLLCTSLPQPPDDVELALPEPEPGTTIRDQLVRHSTDPTCAGCHELMDPIGLGLEHYDAIGRYRDHDGALVVDATGELLHTEDANGSFDGARELGAMLADSDQVRRCMVTQYFRYALARGDAPEDDCSRAAAYRRYEESGWDIRELLFAITRTDAFLHHRAAP